ncbi:hypothetical protein Pmar_PMAR028862 [Perkinsus marinus ATCC 50983]|uniref:Uncharacterized protein n=1 Tax=Perkinsus marinus (strain ATCC 50983 / TXsc) TaxID=423536 RepID=C5LLK7_PERM5|nr:hypothetical protein Pmar_PMAR028862 [Perkinsus marinus ATCC 50983]EER02387.1 hypothetical protein Pmar_PMAR028862 [Perkinsus marinus ATCC 50983]|eukprot:XP_002769669.1 hypothetical protein Pmar_PMAR028862 [Perkinsus marinus ATCC 50983]
MAAHLFFAMLQEYEDRRFADPEGVDVLRLSNVVLINADFPGLCFALFGALLEKQSDREEDLAS